MHKIPARIESMDDAMVEAYRTKTVPQRLAIANGLFLMARTMISAQIQQAHPDWSPEKVQSETSGRIARGSD